MGGAMLQRAFDFAPPGDPVLGAASMWVFFNGTFTEPRISHPEGVAIGPDGWIWCGNQDGDIIRIAPDGGAMERVFSTGGFALGLAFDGERALFVCDHRQGGVFRYDLKTGALDLWKADGLRIPNYPCVDPKRGVLFVSDSFGDDEPGPGIFRFDCATGAAALWFDEPMFFANGLALAPDGASLFVCETFAPCITQITINADGSAGERSVFAGDLPGLPDGIAFDRAGNLVVGCYEPSRLLRISPGGQVSLLAHDITAHTLCHPTNIAFDGDRLFTANLGRWHITEIAADIGAPALWKASA